MAQRCILSGALRGLKLFPTTAHYGVTLAGIDCNDSNRRKKQVSDIKKLCSGALPLSLNASISCKQNLVSRFDLFPIFNNGIFAIVDGASALRHDVLTFPVACEEPEAANNAATKKPLTTDQSVQTDDAAISDKPSRLEGLIDDLESDLQNICAVEQARQGNVEKAASKWKVAAKLGSVPALYNLGAYHCFWKQTGNDFEKGASFWKIAMHRGSLKSMYQLGALHFRQLLEHSDQAYGLELIEKAADGGYAEARYFMGTRMLKFGNYAAAENYLKNIIHKRAYRKELRAWLLKSNLPNEAVALVEKLLRKR